MPTPKKWLDRKEYQAAMAQPLTQQEKVFVTEYLESLNAVQAAETAGYSATAAKNAGKWTKHSWSCPKPHIAKALQDAFAWRRRRALVDADRVLDEYTKLAFLDPRSYFDPDTGDLIPVHKLPEEAAAALQAVNIRKGGKDGEQIIKIKFADKKAALDSLAKHLGLFADKTSDRSTLDDATLNALFSALPAAFAKQVMAALTEQVPKAVNPATPPLPAPAPTDDSTKARMS